MSRALYRGLVAALLGITLLAAAYISRLSRSVPSRPPVQHRAAKYDGTRLAPPPRRPTLTLTDADGKRFAFGTATARHPTFLYFGYTNCPDVCPETMADIGIALTKVSPAIARRTYVVFVTTDVSHDTGPVIKQWLANFSHGSKATWVGLRGSQAQIDAAQAAADIPLATDDGQTHSAQALLYGPDDYAHLTFLQSNDEQQAMAHDLSLVADEGR
jgi:protein SCO1/2